MDLRINILKQQIQKEVELAKRLESIGREKEASIHYMRASAIYRKLAYISPRSEAKALFENASTYETHGRRITSKKAEHMPEIENLIVSEKPTVTWNDIGGLEEAKQTIKEAVILPMIKEKPEFVRVSKSILLYGPPGTGKTLLAKAACNMLNATFFEARASNLLSKYFGESSKLIDGLFSKAREMQPSIIFIDEIDAIALKRSGDMNDASRRVLTEVLTNLDGFSTRKEEKVVVIAATNKPWDLDDALISRFQRRIHVPLPDFHARMRILEIHLSGVTLENITLTELARRTENYSGRDLANLCSATIMNMIREENPELADMDVQMVENYKLKYRPLKRGDFEKTLSKIKPTVDPEIKKKYETWEKSLGA